MRPVCFYQEASLYRSRLVSSLNHHMDLLSLKERAILARIANPRPCLMEANILTRHQRLRKHRRPRPLRPPRRFHPHGQLLLRQHRHVAKESQNRRPLQRPIPFTRLVQPHATWARQRPLESAVFERRSRGFPWRPIHLRPRWVLHWRCGCERWNCGVGC